MNELIQNGDFVNIYMHEKTKKISKKIFTLKKLKLQFMISKKYIKNK